MSSTTAATAEPDSPPGTGVVLLKCTLMLEQIALCGGSLEVCSDTLEGYWDAALSFISSKRHAYYIVIQLRRRFSAH